MKALLAVVLSLTMILTGCSAAWVSTLDSILAAAAPALINILQIIALVNGQPVNTTLASKINTDAATIKQLAADFANASANAAPGACQQLQAAVAVYSQDQQAVLALAQVQNSAVQQKIVILSGLVASTIAAITAVIPACNAPAKLKAEPPISVRIFVTQYNAALTAKTGNLGVDSLTPKLKLHQHSKFVRIVTFGIAK